MLPSFAVGTKGGDMPNCALDRFPDGRLAGRVLSAPSQVSTGAFPGRRHSLRSSNQPTAPAAMKAGSEGPPASTRTPITISTAMAPNNASAGLSSATATIMDNCAYSRRLKAFLLANTDLGCSAEAVSEPPLGFITGAELKGRSVRCG